ncbi:Lrp/AsnC family transcriptional regulator [Halorarius halobius]|uniref:Lrp/AsnC family transcriptional regulator n=1 Tax=Halorarius halobius TaxID=2962671 RepID=UPI0020CC87FA|nr:Lrp/AsnC ligand binding domain-containing protein [Halorarius halobius]
MSVVHAYVMVKAYTGDADDLKDEIGGIDGVESVHIVAGDVDLIAKLSVDSPADVKDIAATQVQNLEGVEDTQTYIAME